MGHKTKNETEKKGNTLHADLRIKNKRQQRPLYYCFMPPRREAALSLSRYYW